MIERSNGIVHIVLNTVVNRVLVVQWPLVDFVLNSFTVGFLVGTNVGLSVFGTLVGTQEDHLVGASVAATVTVNFTFC